MVAVLVCVENRPPHDVAVFQLSAALARRAEQRRDELMSQLAECQRLNFWPGRYSEPLTLDLPTWAQAELGDEGDEAADLDQAGDEEEAP